MHLSFDIPSGKTIARAMLIPSGIAANQELPTAFVLGQTTSRTFIDVDVTKLRQLMIQGANVSLTVRLEMTDGSVILEETNGFEVGIPIFDGNVSTESALFSEDEWGKFSDDEKKILTDAISFGNEIPETNAKILKWLLENFLSPSSSNDHAMEYDINNHEWIGSAYEAKDGPNGLGGQCKWWADDIVAQGSISVDLPSNIQGELADQWLNSAQVTGQANWENGNLEEVINDEILNIQPGDFIQMDDSTGENFQHTAIIGKIDEDGIWVFDSNYNNDGAPRYHKILYSTLNKYDRYSIYRLTPNQ